jgi:hypothetical protein
MPPKLSCVVTGSRVLTKITRTEYAGLPSKLVNTDTKYFSGNHIHLSSDCRVVTLAAYVG